MFAIHREPVCNGHDLTAILAVGLKRTLGNITLPIEELERLLRLAYEREHFRKTRLHSSIRTWESRNVPYRVIAP